jgi:general secretion pathway protein L
VRVGVQRSLVTVKGLELPAAVAGNLDEMLRFELERHVPFTPEDMCFDSLILPQIKDGPVRVLVAACERRIVDRAMRLLEEPKLRALCVTTACHDLPALLRGRFKGRRVVWAHRSRGGTDLVFLGSGQLRLSRAAPIADGAELAAEIGASLRLLKWKDCDAIWVSGDDADEFLSASGLGSAPVSDPPWSPWAAGIIDAFPEEDRGTAILALAVAAGRKRPELNLLPEDQRPRTLTPAQVIVSTLVVVAAGLGVGALLLQGYQDRQYMYRLDAAARALDTQVRQVDLIAKDLNERKRLLNAMRTVESGTLRALPLLRELTDLLPQDAWLNSLSVDSKSVELTGQAGAASQLIPLLENSGWLAGVEFTSPVTRGRDREQFRIKAALENGPGGPPVPAATAPERGAPERPGAVAPERPGGPRPARPAPAATRPVPAAERPGSTAPGGPTREPEG